MFAISPYSSAYIIVLSSKPRILSVQITCLSLHNTKRTSSFPKHLMLRFGDWVPRRQEESYEATEADNTDSAQAFFDKYMRDDGINSGMDLSDMD